jgi:hypothetical protein
MTQKLDKPQSVFAFDRTTSLFDDAPANITSVIGIQNEYNVIVDNHTYFSAQSTKTFNFKIKAVSSGYYHTLILLGTTH